MTNSQQSEALRITKLLEEILATSEIIKARNEFNWYYTSKEETIKENLELIRQLETESIAKHQYHIEVERWVERQRIVGILEEMKYKSTIPYADELLQEAIELINNP